MARTWNDALYGPPPRSKPVINETVEAEEEPAYEFENECRCDDRDQSQSQPHRCFSLWCTHILPPEIQAEIRLNRSIEYRDTTTNPTPHRKK
ncbi:uncharacterized protein FOMMEDRAFT_143034 [Fomitiporia mediterranea MF3/22]|uniref:uncharacterized protein n=1 Tax=Fomitiporia mediterranea (strain MF3/22) TaxID=694068 RepID=UPI00044098CF|nr:uncharacterized protein FOMMEDRAFT_143034 [Fomitiporia mediterranea MF3/22]EJC98560.1 hypothetical protein FOMMEDRAFT_143034 [Fomitiporia mediterranea MF3/22]